ncbi:hypothetical protein V1477_007367, partial [Vespula maculifrons]
FPFVRRRVHIAVLIGYVSRKITLWSGDTELRETTTKSSVRPTLTIIGSVLLRISSSTHRSSRSTHFPRYIIITRPFKILYDLFRFRIKLWSGDTELRETTTKSSVRPTLTVIGSVLLRISKSTHRSSRSTHSPQYIIITRPFNILYDLFRFRIKLWSGDTELRETTTKSSVRPTLTINGSVLLRISKSTHRSSRSTHSPRVITKKLNCGVGIPSFVRRQQSRAFDRL